MQLVFDHIQHIASGHNPAAWHSPDQIAQVYYTDAGGRIQAVDTETEYGDFAYRIFSLPHLAGPDAGVDSLVIAYKPHAYFLWCAGGQRIASVPIIAWFAGQTRRRIRIAVHSYHQTRRIVKSWIRRSFQTFRKVLKLICDPFKTFEVSREFYAIEFAPDYHFREIETDVEFTDGALDFTFREVKY